MTKKIVNKLSVFGFFSLTATMVWTVYEYPTFALAKLNLLFYVIIGGFFWFLPVALVSAEMASTEGFEKGGIFGWIYNTLGPRYGLCAICFEWFQAMIAFITMCYFIIGVISDVLKIPSLENNPNFKFIMLCIIFLSITFVQFKGLKNTVILAKIGMVFGIIIPTLVFGILSVIYIVKNYPLQIPISLSNIIPDFHKLSTLVVAASFVLAFGGIEASATEINMLNKPKKNYPLVILLLTFVTILIDAIGGLSIALVVPSKELSLNTGIVQALKYLINTLFGSGYEIFVDILVVGMIIGVLAQISSWVMGPTETLLYTSKQKLLPKWCNQVNKYNIPTHLLILQSIIVLAFAAFLTYSSKSANVSFLVAVSLTSVIYLCAYILLFIAYFKLVIKMKNKKRSYEFTTKNWLKILIASVGLIISLITFCIAFIRPSSLNQSEGFEYQTMLVLGFIVMFLIPFVIYKVMKKYNNI